ncbi:YtxH domain-containing protein [Listeria booriae]|uniref:YtxH domain-containing protein n=1 Tax=Listeria booriae TaxID=1552123 RepID=UPI0016275923|nr:YtxH domain-containing protein [Listeria booriae]MBC1512012.1 YtxH domain-containing protein [Listeria booriae]MBC2164257.1 YtxH domain-containing protein [Listeria booriae]MBC6150876.1 YtxH domain-containing protein [Listeria booriae]MBC6305058.1 YtxH domain-containing protein [Listeria booriae]
MNAKSIILGALIGGIASAATAIILAPKSGRELRQDIATKSGEAGVILKELAYNATDLLQSVQVLSTEGTTLLKDLSTDIKESVANWNEEMEPEKARLKEEIKDMQKTISDLEKTLKKDKKESN